jgi:hypothetical protein
VAKRWPAAAVALIPTTLVGIGALAWSVSAVDAPCSEGPRGNIVDEGDP